MPIVIHIDTATLNNKALATSFLTKTYDAFPSLKLSIVLITLSLCKSFVVPHAFNK